MQRAFGALIAALATRSVRDQESLAAVVGAATTHLFYVLRRKAGHNWLDAVHIEVVALSADGAINSKVRFALVVIEGAHAMEETVVT